MIELTALSIAALAQTVALEPPARGLREPPAACRSDAEKTRDPAPPHFDRLGDLPDAHEEIAVNRSLGGCPAPIVVRQDVSGKR